MLVLALGLCLILVVSTVTTKMNMNIFVRKNRNLGIRKVMREGEQLLEEHYYFLYQRLRR